MVAPPTTRAFDLAQVNVALPRETRISAIFADFIAALAPINALAESSQAFVWRFQEDGGNAVTVRKFGTRVNLGKKFSQRGLRRTFNDLARYAKVEDIVKKSISRHLTDSMVERYSTVQRNEQREGIGRVLTLVEGSQSSDPPPSGAPGSSSGAL